ncbi:MAG: hypothetical protein C4293_08485, partial [Nitrospiraceae bacterium]
MFEQILYDIPERWQEVIELLAAPLMWIPEMQQAVMDFLFESSSGWLVALKVALLLFPMLLW